MCLLWAYTTRLVSGWPMQRACGRPSCACGDVYRSSRQKCAVFAYCTQSIFKVEYTGDAVQTDPVAAVRALLAIALQVRQATGEHPFVERRHGR